MHPRGKFFREDRVDKTVTLDPALAGKRCCYDRDAEMGFTLGTMAGMTDMAVRLVDDVEVLRRKRSVEFPLEGGTDGHERTFEVVAPQRLRGRDAEGIVTG